MNYEKAYKEALERARKIYNDTEFDYEKGMMEEVFPELAKSEDEKIRKALIRFHKSTIDVDGIKGEDIIAWLIAKHYDDGYQDAVEKAIEHIKNHWDEILVYDFNQLGGCVFNMKKTLDNFRKAMEE